VTARARPTSVRWVICGLLTLASFVAYLLRTNMSVAGERMMGDLGITQLQLGAVLAAFAWGYAIFQFPGGVLGDLIGVRRALALMAILWGLLNFLVGLVPGRAVASPAMLLALLVGLRFLMGAAQAPLFPVIGGGAVSNWFPVSGWALPSGLQNAGLTLGSAATGPLIAWLMERFGWRQSFMLTAPIALLLAGWWWWYGRDYPGQHPRVSRSELELIDAGRSLPPPSPERGAWKLVLRNREILLLAGSYFCTNYLFYFFFNWLFIYLIKSRQFRILEGGFCAAAPWITGAVGALLGGILCDRLVRNFGERWGYRIPSVTGLVLSAAFLLAAATAANAQLAVVFLSLCLGAPQLTDPAYWAGTIAVSGRHVSAACGVLNTGGNLVGGIGALLVPFTVRHLGWPAALATGSLFALAGAALWLLVRVDRHMIEPVELRQQAVPPASAVGWS
jgi:ACS family glucarate transporter-like MFS transporter